MDNLQVIKVKFSGSMCRISARKSTDENVISLTALETRLRASFKLPTAAYLALTYKDSDGDVITISSDQDIVDALVYQELNPLRIDLDVQLPEGVTLASRTTSLSLDSSSDTASNASHAAPLEAPPAKVPTADAPPAYAPAPAPTVPATVSPASGAIAEEKAELPPAPAAAVVPENEAKVEEAAQKLHEVTAMVEKQLREVLGMSNNIGRLAREYEPLLKVAPRKIAEVLEAALKSGLSVSFEPVIDEPSDSSTAPDAEESAAAATTPPADTPQQDPAKEEASAPSSKTSSEGLTAALDDVTTAASAAATAATAEASAAAEAVCKIAAASSAASPFPVLPVHNGIICDGCDMNPLVGPRYTSLVKHDYDLCEACFKSSKDDPSSYKCNLQPVFRPRHGPHFHHAGPAVWASPFQPGGRAMRCGPPGPPGFGGRMVHHRGPTFTPPCFVDAGHAFVKLEARFVKDVSIPDNMEVLPGQRFTKIWRLRNTGGAPWPQHTQIVHIGGDALGEKNAVLLEIPPGGVMPEAELDVSVDMVAPTKLGRYMSHWRLCSPRGPKFGHRVWVLIQVVSPFEGDNLSDASNKTQGPDKKGLPQLAPKTTPENTPAVVSPSAPAMPSALPTVIFPWHVTKEHAAAVSASAVASGSAGAAAPFPGAAVVGSPAASSSSAEVDPVIAAVAAAVPPRAEVRVTEVEEKDVKEKEAAGSPASASAVEEVKVEEATDTTKALAASVSAPAEDGFVEVPPPPALEPAVPVESTTVGSFSLVDAPADEKPVLEEAPEPAATAVDGFVDTGVAAGAKSAPNGQALNNSAPAPAPAPATTPAPVPAVAEKVKSAAASAREMMFEVEDEAEAEALDQLEGMGFVDRDLNRAVFVKSGGNLFQAVEALMGLSDWDPMLAELEEMGFDDKMLNKRIMYKHGGSVKGTVRELVHLYRMKDVL